MSIELQASHIYDGEGDQLMESLDRSDRVVLLPDRDHTNLTGADQQVRIMWGQWLLADLLAGRYRSLVCAVNANDNSHGIISRLAELLPTSQWREASITSHAKHFVQPHNVTVVKYDMDAVEVLALLRPAEHEHLTLGDLSLGFRVVSEMLRRRPQRFPTASVCFLGARANLLVAEDDREPSFEAVLRTMHEAGYRGDVYPATWMWSSSSVPVFARYPFPDAIERMREGGF